MTHHDGGDELAVLDHRTDDTATGTAPMPGAAAYPTLAALSVGAAVIHFAMVPAHAGESVAEGIAFAAVGWMQLVLAGVLLVRPHRRALALGIAMQLAVVAIWAWSRTKGLPTGPSAGVAQTVGAIDLTATALEAAFALGAASVLARPGRVVADRAPAAGSRRTRLLASGFASFAVLAITTAVVASPSTSDHVHSQGNTLVAAGPGAPEEHADGHLHDDAHDHHAGATPAATGPQRCDLDLNPAAYYREAEVAGVNAMEGMEGMEGMDHGSMSGHDHGSMSDPAGGSNATMDHSAHSPEQHSAMSATQARLSELASKDGELDAAALVVELSKVSDGEYDEFLRNLKASAHAARRAAPDDNGGHGGHMGPQQWTPITDPAACAQLHSEIEQTRAVLAANRTAADAKRNGYIQVTPYVPGIAGHYMNFRYVDGTFEIDKPEMILYDGNGDDAIAIGLSYYVIHTGEGEPKQGFTGPNDHFHRHVGLCVRGTMVVGDTSLSKEECEAIGGTKQNGGAGWMNHVWSVPGCESPWGLFSAASPLLDGELPNVSGQGAPCSGSSVRDRYDLSPGPPGGAASGGSANETAAGR